MLPRAYRLISPKSIFTAVRLVGAVFLLTSCELDQEDDLDPIVEEPIVEEVPDGGLDTLGHWQWVELGGIELAGHDIAFASPDTVYLANNIFHPFPGLKISYDGGQTWLPGQSTYNIIKGWNRMHVISSDQVFLYGRYVPMLSRFDYTANIYHFNFNDLYTSTYREFFYYGWNGFVSDVGSRQEDVYALSYMNEVVVKGKEDYSDYSFGSSKGLLSIAFASDSVGFIGSKEGELLATMDRNKTWKSILKDPENLAFVEILFVDPTLGFVLTNSNVIYRTDDGGASWHRILLPHKAAPQDIYYLNKKLVMVDGQRGFTNYGREVFETKDGGQTWARTLRVGQASVNGISYDHVGAIWAVTGVGLLKMELAASP